MWIYKQSSGELAHDSEHIAYGYSGNGIGKNNPLMQEVHNVGPIPRGTYTIRTITDASAEPLDYEGKKAPVLRLTPLPDDQMFGRDGFLMHGDSVSEPGTASQGCIIMAHWVRDMVRINADDQLQVVV